MELLVITFASMTTQTSPLYCYRKETRHKTRQYRVATIASTNQLTQKISMFLEKYKYLVCEFHIPPKSLGTKNRSIG